MRIVKAIPHGMTFPQGVTLSLRAPAGLTNLRAYRKNVGTGAWEPVDFTAKGSEVAIKTRTFSYYGVGGDPVQTSSVPASSPWSLAVLALAGTALGVAPLKRTVRSAT